MDWKTLLAYITGTVDQELLLRNEYLATENRILRNQITGRVHLTDAERKTLAEIGKKLGKQALEEVASLVKPDIILGWHRKLEAQKFHIPSDFVVECVTAQQKPPDVGIWRLSNQSRVGTVPPSTSTPHCPAC
jgi:hypothetical protein